MSTIELSNGSATLTARADYLLVVEHGTLVTSAEVLRYVTELDGAGQRYHLRRLLVDARSESDEAESRGDARSAMWRWIRTQKTFDMIGFVLRDEMTIARVNMTALSERLVVRAFIAVADGHRWLARARPSSTAIPAAVRPAPSSVPPPPMGSRTPTPPPASPSARDSATRLTRSTARMAALSASDADAVLAGSSRPPTPAAGTSPRSTVKIPAIDERTAEEVLASSTPPAGIRGKTPR
jgi:hypothetical protein